MTEPERKPGPLLTDETRRASRALSVMVQGVAVIMFAAAAVAILAPVETARDFIVFAGGVASGFLVGKSNQRMSGK